MAAYQEVSNRKAVLAAIEEYDTLGRKDFLFKYGFQSARRFFLVHEGKEYASKAILGVAHKYQFGKALRWDDFSGGRASVQPVLENLGFTVIERTPGSHPKPASSKVDTSWSKAELKASVISYLTLREHEGDKKFRKSAIYEQLSKQFGRAAKAYEFRMQNISYVLTLMGRPWVKGLKPLRNVGVTNAVLIEELLKDHLLISDAPVVAFAMEAQKAKRSKAKAPTGNKSPASIVSSTVRYQRDASVVGWVLAQAKGVCECCQKPAPFSNADGPFLEVHHVRLLADKGSDTVSNAIAICPNCHRRLHYGLDRSEVIERIYRRHKRLLRE